VMQQYDKLRQLFAALQEMDAVRATVEGLLDLFDDVDFFGEVFCLRLVGDIVAAGTYRMESDGFVLPFVTAEVQFVDVQFSRVIEQGKLPEIPAPALSELKKFAAGNLQTVGSMTLTPAMHNVVKSKLSSTYTYFKKRFKGEGTTDAERRLQPMLACARVAELLHLNPHTRGLSDQDIKARLLTAPPALFDRTSPLNPDAVRMTGTPNWTDAWLLEYHQAKMDVATISPYALPQQDTKTFLPANGEYCYSWWQKRPKFPLWHKLSRTLAILQASSGTVERVFSLYDRVCREDNSLMDYRRARVIIPYNTRMRETPVISVQ
jgi:hypothetical protein